MDVTTLHEVEEKLGLLDPDTLREMAFQTARSHAAVCGMTSQIGDCAHIGSDEIRDRVETMPVADLVAALAPLAWVSIDVHGRIGG
jgi:hypothetical protein